MVMYTRNEILGMLDTIDPVGGIYKWYVTQEGANILGIPVEGCVVKEGRHLIYIGLSKDLRMRLKWHCGDKHSQSAIKSGILSMVRQKINTLLNDRWDSRELVDEFMDTHMRVEFEHTPDFKEKELTLIKSHVLPLNVRHNDHPFRKVLSKRNGQAKRNTINSF